MKRSGDKVTIKSIADALSISFSTVSKALNGDPSISEHTRQLVQEKAKQMNYTRNYFASCLRQSSSQTVAIIMNEIDIPAYGELMAMISGELAPHGYTTTISDTQYNDKFERMCIQNVVSRMPDAVVIAPADPCGENIKLLSSVWNQTLVLGKIPGQANANTVFVDHRLAGRLSASHMLDNGVRKNLILGGPSGYQSSEYFISGIAAAYQERGTAFNPDDVYRFKPSAQEACKVFLSVWEKAPGSIDGVICFCDSMALGIYKACKELGLKVGEDISVIGYDDNFTNDFTSPALTSIHLPKDQVAARCTEFIFNRLIHGNNDPFHCTINPVLVDRGSVCKTK